MTAATPAASMETITSGAQDRRGQPHATTIDMSAGARGSTQIIVLPKLARVMLHRTGEGSCPALSA
jgi:hypothetical protein